MEYLNTIVADPWWRRAVVFYFGEHPEDSAALNSAIAALRGRSIEETYNSALTLGLALQACYLIEVKEKIEIYRWVVDGISNAKEEFLTAGESKDVFPLTRFIYYYLFGRDSVALSVLETRIQEILEKLNIAELSQDDKDVRTFWIICGLIECGAISDVEDLLAKFKPSDPRLLLGIHLGCYLTQNVRVSTKHQCASAKRICELLSGRINHLRAQLLEEMKTELLEVRKGAITTIETSSTPVNGDNGEEERPS